MPSDFRWHSFLVSAGYLPDTPIIMAREKKPVHKVQMTEGKRNIIHQLLEEYDIQSICMRQSLAKWMSNEEIWWH